MQNTKTLVQEAKKIGLEINEEKTKVMETLPEIDEEDHTVDNYVFEKASIFESFKYLGLGVTITCNDWNTEKSNRSLKAVTHDTP